MSIIPIPAFQDNYIWHIIDEDTRHTICVDPGEAEPVLSFLAKENLFLKAIFLTHHHFDHIGGVSALLKAHPETAVFGPQDSRIPLITHPLQEGDNLNLTPYRFKILETPGHTSTHISFYEPHFNWLFCGDTLFSAGCGRVFDGTIEALHHSLQKLKNLPEQTLVCCAHEYTQQNLRFATLVESNNSTIKRYLHELSQKEAKFCSLPSTIAQEKKINPFFRTEESEVQQFALHQGAKKTDSLTIFRQLRAEKDKF